MTRLIVLSGLPGAGKSTVAKRLVGESRCALLSRDELRYALRYVHDESLITHLMAILARTLLDNKFDVVVDACNLLASDCTLWTEVACDAEAELEWITLDTPVDECIRRDMQRPYANGEARIREAAKQRDMVKEK